MEPIVLYCCSYEPDLARALRLAESVARHNRDNLALYVSTPKGEEQAFRNRLGSLATVFCRDDILAANPAIDRGRVEALPGIVQQQIIKSEFWRLGIAANAVVIDSDAKFIRDFSRTDFLAEPDVPYTVMHQGRDLLQFVALHGPARARDEFVKDRAPIMREMGREGVIYDFGYSPYLWSARVWRDLAEKHLAPRGETFVDAVLRYPSEFTWYGEALLRFRSIPLYPRVQMFRFYHYEHQFWNDRDAGISEEVLAGDYFGVVYQSNWETWMQFGRPSKSLPSRVARSVKRAIKRARHKLT